MKVVKLNTQDEALQALKDSLVETKSITTTTEYPDAIKVTVGPIDVVGNQ